MHIYYHSTGRQTEGGVGEQFLNEAQISDHREPALFTARLFIMNS